MSVQNHTPFSAIAFRQYNLAGRLNGVVAVRGTFRVALNGPLVPVKAQAPLVLADTYDGDPHQGPLTAQSDLVPFKPGTDVTLIGLAYAPDRRPLPHWLCTLRVGSLRKTLRVMGPRSWRAKIHVPAAGWGTRAGKAALAGWELGQPAPVATVPLDWRLAYGGLLPGRIGPGPDGRYPLNPIGCGIVDKARFDELEDCPAPQIEDPAKPVLSADEAMRPEGFGPLPPWWNQRYQYAGTYDDDWLRDRHPLLPADFDYRFYQCAHPDLIATPWLEGDEDYELENLAPRHPLVRGRLPGVRLQVTIDQGRGPEVAPLVLDGVHFDLRPGIGRVFLTWRTAFPWPERRGLPALHCLTPLPEAA
jgi:hypothetical protein